MKIIVGLGNPGRKYRSTPHNVGYWVADRLAGRWGESFTVRRREQAEVLETRIDGEPILLAKPTTYMNRSGQAVRSLMTNRPVELSDLLIVLDEVQLPLGRIRVRPSGSYGGHNGLLSIIQCVGSEEVPRLRIGVGDGRGLPEDRADYVLGSLAPREAERLGIMAEIGADAVELWAREGAEAAADRFNGLREFETQEEL